MLILLAEDDPEIADIVKGWLTNAKHFFIVVNTAERLLEEVAKTGKFDLIITDNSMGAGKKGIDAIREIRKISDIPIILHSGDGFEEAMLTGLRVTFLEKPARKADFNAAIQLATETTIFK